MDAESEEKQLFNFLEKAKDSFRFWRKGYEKDQVLGDGQYIIAENGKQMKITFFYAKGMLKIEEKSRKGDFVKFLLRGSKIYSKFIEFQAGIFDRAKWNTFEIRKEEIKKKINYS